MRDTIKVEADGFRTRKVGSLDRAKKVAKRWIAFRGSDVWTGRPLRVTISQGRKVVEVLNDHGAYC